MSKAGNKRKSQERQRIREKTLNAEAKIRKVCERMGAALRITGGGQHWIITKDKRRAEWWPTTGKLVFDMKYKNGVNCKKYEKMLKEVNRRFDALPELNIKVKDPQDEIYDLQVQVDTLRKVLTGQTIKTEVFQQQGVSSRDLQAAIGTKLDLVITPDGDGQFIERK